MIMIIIKLVIYLSIRELIRLLKLYGTKVSFIINLICIRKRVHIFFSIIKFLNKTKNLRNIFQTMSLTN